MNQDDVVIAVMGATGSGKSSFVKLVTGDPTVKVGESMESETSEVKDYRFFHEDSGREVILVDTPGFDDSRTDAINDTDVLKMISGFLVREYDAQRKLNGLIYIQRINEPRFSGQSARNLRMFKNLCGTQTYQNVVVLTTHWDSNDPNDVKERREHELKTKFFKELVSGGAKFMRHDRTLPSAYGVLEHIFTLTPKNVQIQQELCVEKKTLEETSAGLVHREEVERIIAQHKAEVDGLKKEMDDLRGHNEAARRELEREREELRQKLAKWEDERRDLQKGLEEERRGREQFESRAAEEKASYARWQQEQEEKLSAQLKAQSEAHDLEVKGLRDQFAKEKEARERAERLRREEEEDRLAAQARNQQKFMNTGLRVAEKLPLVPNVLAKPVLGGLGIGVDHVMSLGRGRRK
ncbi:hypothetical protein AAF712_007443 [Marasmius tenuissimus]|uniref:AIG1-type G domain-containing protein n=1 Tax=Marasmius tenuissimus TaxID=585030 RepID=A0ABR2ZZ02_9AGAR